MSSQKPREIAVRALHAALRGEEFIEDLLEQELRTASMPPADRRLAQELAYGVTRWRATLDWLISRKTEGRPQKPMLLLLLRLGLYQIFWLDRVPDHAAVHETVELVKQFGFAHQAGFVNAILRGYVREKEATRRLLTELRETDLSLGFSHPAWICSRWVSRWGEEKTRWLLDWNNSPPPLFARVNTLRIDPGKLLTQWREKENIEYDFFFGDWVPENLVFRLKPPGDLSQLESFRQGGFYAQDPSTLLALRELAPQPGESILDLCAAPGGKTTYIAQLMENRGVIVAQDIHPGRLGLLRSNCERLGVACVEIVRPPENLVPELSRSFDRVLVDAPCSNTGVMRRRVELRWRLRPEELPRLVVTQLELLRRGAAQLKPGGLLVYSTCSLEPEENQDVVRTFLKEEPSFRLEGERELLPFVDGVDGAYVARLRKRG